MSERNRLVCQSNLTETERKAQHSESKLSDKVCNAEVFPPGYQSNVFRKDRNDHGGRVFLAFKDGYVVTPLKETDPDCESIWAEVAIPKKPPMFISSF